MLVLAASMSVSTLSGQEFRPAAPETVGMSSKRLAGIDEYIQRHLDASHFAGAVTVVARRGKVVQFKAYGMQDIENVVPMATDSIFRIYSMTKPITSVAVMTLFEEGRFLLNDPVSKFLPEFKDLVVGLDEVDETTGETVLTTEAAIREVTIRDLLRHTSGLTYGFWGNTLVDKMYLEKQVLSRETTIQDTVTKLGTIPLRHQPGTVWEYSVSTDVLGRLVEVVSGMPFDEFLRARIFVPLGMKDTGFFVPTGKGRPVDHRLHTQRRQLGPLAKQPAKARDFTEPPGYFSGGGGLVSTAADYLRFAQMLLNRGELAGTRILGSETVELMTSNHLAGIEDRGYLNPNGFGLGFMIMPERGVSGLILSEGSFGWGGLAHTNFWVDPEEELVGVFLIQILPEAPIPYRDLFRPVVYQAIID